MFKQNFLAIHLYCLIDERTTVLTCFFLLLHSVILVVFYSALTHKNKKLSSSKPSADVLLLIFPINHNLKNQVANLQILSELRLRHPAEFKLQVVCMESP